MSGATTAFSGLWPEIQPTPPFPCRIPVRKPVPWAAQQPAAPSLCPMQEPGSDGSRYRRRRAGEVSRADKEATKCPAMLCLALSWLAFTRGCTHLVSEPPSACSLDVSGSEQVTGHLGATTHLDMESTATSECVAITPQNTANFQNLGVQGRSALSGRAVSTAACPGGLGVAAHRKSRLPPQLRFWPRSLSLRVHQDGTPTKSTTWHIATGS